MFLWQIVHILLLQLTVNNANAILTIVFVWSEFFALVTLYDFNFVEGILWIGQFKSQVRRRLRAVKNEIRVSVILFRGEVLLREIPLVLIPF